MGNFQKDINSEEQSLVTQGWGWGEETYNGVIVYYQHDVWPGTG